MEAKPEPTRETEVVESSETSPVDNWRSGAHSGPHVCRFCGQQFTKPQALGGHMNKHRDGELIGECYYASNYSLAIENSILCFNFCNTRTCTSCEVENLISYYHQYILSLELFIWNVQNICVTNTWFIFKILKHYVK